LPPLADRLILEIDVGQGVPVRVADDEAVLALKGRDWQLFARECGLNPRQVLERVRTLAASAIAEAGAAECEVAGMPAGKHPILNQTRQAVERRAHLLLEQLQEIEDEPVIDAATTAAPR
jgi:serine/threonine-protein kinase HipA